MKIITNTRRDGELCYVQVKDLLFLAKLIKNNNIMQQYVSMINNGRLDNDFVRVTQEGYKNAIKKCDYIVDFTEFSSKKVSVSYLSKVIVTMSISTMDKNESEYVEYKADGLRDIMAFKKGELDYKMPLIVNGGLEYENKDKSLYLDDTILDDCFVIKTVDGSPVQNHDYFEFYLECVDKIYNDLYPEILQDERSFEVFDRGNTLLIIIRNQEKKKVNGFSKILGKLKKEVK